MTKAETLKSLVDQSIKTFLIDNEVAVETGCLFPSNGSVIVYVSGGSELCVVSDHGAAAQTVYAHGVQVPDVRRWLGPFCKDNGLRLEGTHITSPPVGISHLPTVISLVANTASIAARYAIDKYTSEIGVRLIERLQDSLISVFGQRNIARDVEMAGASNRTYRFDFQIGSNKNRRIFLDHVNPHPSSINAKAAAHIDLGRLEDNTISQFLVYDKNAKWNSADLSFLQLAAQLLPVSRVGDVLQKSTRH